jgi:hypothetical protein
MLVADKGWVALSAHYEEKPPTVIVREVEVMPEDEAPESPHYQPSLI